MPLPLNILMLEDSESDAEIVQRLLIKDNPLYLFKVAMSKKSFIEDLEKFQPDIILADNSLPQFDAREALELVGKKSINIPFIMVTGAVSEQFAADIIKLGADDYILKDGLWRLSKAIDDALKQRRVEKEKTEALFLLVQSEENLKAIFDSASEGFILTDTEGLVQDFNNRARDAIFQNIHEYIQKGQTIYKYIETERTDFLKKVISKVLQGETIHYDRLFPSENKINWINYSFNPVWEKQKIHGICITGRNITQRKIAEQQKDFEQNNLYALINNTKDLMWSVDLDFNLITSNQAFEELVVMLSGTKPVKGTNLLTGTFTGEQLSRFRIHYERAFAGETFTVIEYIEKPVELWSELSFYPIHEGNSVIGTACFARNITQRKKAEEELVSSFYEKRVQAERMSAILNTLPANIVLLDEKGVIKDVNEAWKQFVTENKYSGAGFFLNENYLRISKKAIYSNELDDKMIARGIKNVLKNRVREFVYEYLCNSPGVERWFRLIATPLQEKEYAGVVIMHIEISEIRRLEQERLKNKMEEQKKITRLVLKAEEKERSRLGQELHDNISQLLAAIKMKLGFCHSHPEKCLQIIEECTEYVQEAITEARNLSHKMVIPRFEENGFKQSLELLVLKYEAANKSVKLEISRMNEKMVSDEIKETLYRIVQEQLNNIEKYAQASVVLIQILTYPNQLAFVIRDNGVGFDTNVKTNGIGLTNVLNRAESYNGSARIISEPGKGCSLFVEIPIGKNGK
ncbi:MAG TPA: PAS domain S-box protein [Puia sp.]